MIPHLLDAVALVEDLPERNLVRGQVGTVVEELAPEAVLVEFTDARGQTWAMEELRSDQVLMLVEAPAGASAS